MIFKTSPPPFQTFKNSQTDYPTALKHPCVLFRFKYNFTQYFGIEIEPPSDESTLLRWPISTLQKNHGRVVWDTNLKPKWEENEITTASKEQKTV